MELVEPVLLYLRHCCDRGKKAWNGVKLTERAACDDLYEWMHYLELIDLDWAAVRPDNIRGYRTALEKAISPRTLKPYATNTVRRRLMTIVAFHTWADVELGDAADFEERRSKRRAPNIDRNALAHVGRGPDLFAQSDLIPGVAPTAPNPFRKVKHLHRVMVALGPLPSSRGKDARATRDRLASTFAVATGARIAEVAALTLAQVLGADRDPTGDAMAHTLMMLHETKGGRPRQIEIPTWLLDEMLAYADTERREVVERARSLGRAAAPNFFLNGIESSDRYVGCALTSRNLSRIFRAAVISAGFYDRVGEDLPGGGPGRTVAQHSFHDLRHTFAIAQYIARKAMGDAEPWKMIATLLGHRSWATTMDYYLPSVSLAEDGLSNVMADFFGSLLSLDGVSYRGR